MTEYRILKVEDNGHVRGEPETLAAESDAEALRKASGLLGDYSLELWAGARYLTTLTRNPTTPHADWIVVAAPD